MAMPLEAIIAHVRAQGRLGTHQAILVARIDELEAEVARLEGQIRINPEEHFRPLMKVIADAVACGQGWSRVTTDGVEHVPLEDVYLPNPKDTTDV